MAKSNTCGTGGCGCSQKTKIGSEEKTAPRESAQEINIEFLYLDLNVCEMCQGTESNLEEALADVSEVLKSTGVKVNLQKTHIESYEQALEKNFISSPTIRINGRDIQFEVQENYCSSCSNLSGTETFCRVWNFRGEEYSTVPKSLVVETVLREIYGTPSDNKSVSPEQNALSLENLKRFFDGREKTGLGIENPKLPPPETKKDTSAACGCS